MLDEAQAREKIRTIFKDEDVIRVWEALEGADSEPLRLVGGAVRNILLGKEAGEDLDFATPIPVGEVEKILKAKNWNDVKILNHGKKYGTIMVVFKQSGQEIDIRTTHANEDDGEEEEGEEEGRQFEITTLRKDIKTDGRHATEIEFIHNWEEGCQTDSTRRDFTVNAIYADKNGEYKKYNFQNGLKDLEDHIVRFVGNPAKRIVEDSLRVLRYYRFVNFFEAISEKKPFLDRESETACDEAIRDGAITSLKVERIWRELRKMLSEAGGNELNALLALQKNGGWSDALKLDGRDITNESTILAEKELLNYLHFLQRTSTRESVSDEITPMMRLAALTSWGPSGQSNILDYSYKIEWRVKHLTKTLKLSRVEVRELSAFYKPFVSSNRWAFSRREWLRALNRQDKYIVWGRLYVWTVTNISRRIQYGTASNVIDDKTLGGTLSGLLDAVSKHIALSDRWEPKKVPITGEAVARILQVQGADIGKKLEEVENWWLEKNCVPNRDDCLKFLRRELERK